MRWIFLLLFVVSNCTYLAAQEQEFDFYIVPHRGDTIREGIKKILFSYHRRRQVAFVRFEDGRKRIYDAGDIKAFSFIESGGWFFGLKFQDTYHQVQVLRLNESKGKKIYTPHFYETIASCNGHTLYLDYNNDVDLPSKLLIAVGNIVKYEFRYKRNAIDEYLYTLMPDCVQPIHEQLWPKWAKNRYKKEAPTKPNF